MPRIEQHPRAFKGIWIPSQLLTLLADKTLSPRELIVLAQIDSLDRTPEGGAPCTASNAYLAQAIGCLPQTVGDIVSKLEEMGFVRRELHRDEATGEVLKRELVSLLQTWVATQPHIDPPSPANSGDPLPGKFRGPSPEKTGKDNIGDKKDNTYSQMADQLRLIIRTRHAVNRSASLKSWTDSFRKLVEVDGVEPERVLRTLSFYGEIYGDKYAPVAESGAAFREKYIRIEDAIRRKLGDSVLAAPSVARGGDESRGIGRRKVLA